MARVRGDFQRLHPQALDDLQQHVIGGRLQRHRVTRLRHRTQGQKHSTGAAIGQQDLVRSQAHPGMYRPARHFLPQGRAALSIGPGRIFRVQAIGPRHQMPQFGLR